MLIKNYLFLLLLFFLLIEGCNTKSTKKLNSVEETKSTKKINSVEETKFTKKFTSVKETIKLSGVEKSVKHTFNTPFTIYCVNQQLIVEDINPKNKLLHLFDLPEYEYIGGVGTIGTKSLDFKGFELIDYYNSNNYVWALDVMENSITKIELNKIKDNDDYKGSLEHFFRDIKVTKFMQMTDSTYLVELSNHKNRFALLDERFDTLFTFLNWKSYEEIFSAQQSTYNELDSRLKNQLFKSDIIKNTNENLIAIVYRILPFFQIVNYTNQKVINVIGPEKLEISSVAVSKRFSYFESVRINYLGACASKNYIYLINSGKPFAERDASKGTQIYQFDWKGNVIRRILLDKKITSIATDNEDSMFYGISENTNNYIIEYSR